MTRLGDCEVKTEHGERTLMVNISGAEHGWPVFLLHGTPGSRTGPMPRPGVLYRRGIRQCIDVTYALTQRQTVWEYAPRSRAAEDYDAFVEFVAGGAQADAAVESSAPRPQQAREAIL